jgi:hypothetical protein
MARKKKTVSEEIPDNASEFIGSESICPTCGRGVATHRCRLCGATRTVSSVSGNVIWMRNGRVVAAFADEKQAFIKMAMHYGIPETEWPKKFRSVK